MLGPINQQNNKYKRVSKPSWMNTTGPYIGKIVNHLDPDYMGRLEVEILKITESGNPGDGTGYIIPCDYVSPFYGVTPREGISPNQTYGSTQKSYGFWAVPPDVGVKVLVLMAENNYSFGFWIGCIQDRYMNFQIPGHASTTYSSNGKLTPVGEYNKEIKQTGADPTKFIKPANSNRYNNLFLQGLEKDHIRGTTTTSARREVPSMVFGWSSPGPTDKASLKYKYGEEYGRTNVFIDRFGGTSFVMDDGDQTLLRKKTAENDPPEYVNLEAGDKSGDKKLLHNELTRWSTRTGHQILMHNTEDIIYIINAQGTTWIELTNNGKIDIYAQDSISMHTEQDINIKTERDINFEAMRNVHIKANEEIYFESLKTTHFKVGEELNIQSGKDTNLKAGEKISMQSGSDWQVQCGANGKITCSLLSHIKSSEHRETAGEIHMNSPNNLAEEASDAKDATEAFIPIRIPEHEPWKSHENLDPMKFKPDKTDSIANKGVVQEEVELVSVPDTFRKSN